MSTCVLSTVTIQLSFPLLCQSIVFDIELLNVTVSLFFFLSSSKLIIFKQNHESAMLFSRDCSLDLTTSFLTVVTDRPKIWPTLRLN